MDLKEYYVIRLNEKLWLEDTELTATLDYKEALPFYDKSEAGRMAGKVGGDIRTQFDWSEE